MASWIARTLGPFRLFTDSLANRVLYIAGLVVLALDVFTDDVDLPYQAYVAIVLVALLLGWAQFNSKRDEVVAGQAAEPVNSTPNHYAGRVGIDAQGGRMKLRKTKIRNHDVGVRSRDTDIDSDDLDMK